MAQIRIDNDNLILTMHGLRRVLALTSELTFPLSSVRGVTYDPNIQADYPSGLEKRKGTNIFNTYYGGRFKQDGDTIFWDVRKPEKTVVITLDDDEYQRLIVEVDDPHETVKMIEEAINRAK